jgi:hypothetical protein
MRHTRPDYNRFQDPLNLIPADEPVFLLRGQDKLAPSTLRHWGNLAIKNKLYDIANVVMKWADEMEAWQKYNESKLPDLKAEIDIIPTLTKETNNLYNKHEVFESVDVSNEEPEMSRE